MHGGGALVVSSRYARRDGCFLPGKRLFGWDSMLRMRAFSLGEQGVEMTSTLELEHVLVMARRHSRWRYFTLPAPSPACPC